MSNQSSEPLLHIATLGKTVGIKGDMKLHIKSDFPEQFVSGASFLINKKERVTLRDVNLERGVVKINNISNPEDAKRYTNTKLFATYEETREKCHLNEGEYFFFDLEDCDVYEDDLLLVFHDIAPQAEVHLLMIPKVHIVSLSDLDASHDAVMAHMMRKLPEIAKQQGLVDGFRTIINTGKGGGQVVFHLHAHLLGGKQLPGFG